MSARSFFACPQSRQWTLVLCLRLDACCLPNLWWRNRDGFLSDAILALLAIPLLALGVWRLFDADVTRQMRWALWFCVALVAVPLIEAIPLPGWLWTHLPHRELSAGSFGLIGKNVPWMPLSVSPEMTWLSALSLLPPLSLFIGVLILGYRERRWLSLVVISIGVVSAFLGLIQVAQGQASPLRFYQFTNTTGARRLLCKPQSLRGPYLYRCFAHGSLGHKCGGHRGFSRPA